MKIGVGAVSHFSPIVITIESMAEILLLAKILRESKELYEKRSAEYKLIQPILEFFGKRGF